ncbi:MAG: carbohydrate binding domain-containing protein [Mycobacterium sp.]
MRAAACATRGAQDRAETFHYYVDPSAGNDSTGTGTKALPYASLSKAFTVMSSGKSVGIKAGTVQRVASALTLPGSGCRVGQYGGRIGVNRPVVSGGALLTSWTGQTPVLGSELLTNPGFESALTTGWTVQVAGPVQDATIHHSGSDSMKITNGTGKLSQNVTLTSGQQYTLSLWHIESVTGKSGAYQLFTGTNYLQTNGTWSTSAGQTNVNTNSTTWAQVQITFTAPSTGTYSLYLQGYDGGTYTTNFDDISVKPVTGFTGPVYGKTLAANPPFVAFTTGGTTTGLGYAGATTVPAANQYGYTGGSIYINLNGTDPATGNVEAATVTALKDTTAGHDCFTSRGISWQFGYDQIISLQNTHGHILDRNEIAYTGYVANSGSIVLANYTNGSLPAYFARVTGNSIHDCQNDGGWSHAIPNLQIDHNTIATIGALLGDVQSDGWQVEDLSTEGFTYHYSAGLWVHHNSISMGSVTPKGCIIYNGYGGTGAGDGGLIEWNTLVGGNYGVASHASNTEVRYNTISAIVSAFGGGIHEDATTSVLDNVNWHHNIIISSGRAGIVVQGGTLTRSNHTIRHNTIYNAARCALDIESPMSGTVSDNIFWWNGTSPSFAAIVQYSSGTALPGALVWTNNLMPDSLTYKGQTANGTGTYTTYATVATWKSGTGFDAVLVTADPTFTNQAGSVFTLQAGSPAIGTASDGANIGAL